MSVSDQTLHGCHTHNACAYSYNKRIVVFFPPIYRKGWLHKGLGLRVPALVYEAFQSLSLVIQTHADCQKRHDSRQRGIFFNALSQQCAYTVDKRMLAAVQQRERGRECENMNEHTVVKALSNGWYITGRVFLGRFKVSRNQNICQRSVIHDKIRMCCLNPLSYIVFKGVSIPTSKFISLYTLIKRTVVAP